MTQGGRLTRDVVVSAVRYADAWLAHQQTYQRIPGVQAAVLHDGDVVLTTAHGRADVELDLALTPDHLFRVASHSKTFTATAVMQLVETGKLALDDAAGNWLPWLEPPVSEITLREMLAHSSGIFRDSLDSDFWQLMRPFPDEAGLREIALSGAAVLPRNERFKYSNITFSLLGLVIRAASGKAYNEYVTTNIVERLGLANTGPELDPTRASEYAAGYSALTYAATRQPIVHVDTAAMSSATGFYSTAEDLCRYFAAHFWGDDRLISDDSKRVLQHDGWEVEHTPDSRYGLGFAVTKVGDRRLVGHGGGYPGHITRSVFDPDDRLAVSVLTNAIDGPAQALANAVVKLIDLAAAKSQPSDARHDRFCGRFANLWGVHDVASLGGQLLLLNPSLPDPTEGYAVLTIQDAATLRVASGPGYGDVGEPLAYAFADDGSIVSVRGPGALTMWPLNDYRERFPLSHDAEVLSRRGFLIAGAGVVVAAGSGLWGVEDGVLPGRIRVGQAMGRCSTDVDPPDVKAPRVQHHSFLSQRRGRDVGWTLAMPPGKESTGLAVALVLHGRADDSRTAFDSLGWHRFLADYVDKGGHRFALAAVDGGQTYWHPRASGDDPLGMVVDELIPRLGAAELDTRRIGVVGWSMGGYGALLMARESGRRHVGDTTVVAACAASPALFPTYASSAQGAFDDKDDFARWGSLLRRPERPEGLALRVACGDTDPFTAATERYRAEVHPTPAGGIDRGCHNRGYWRSEAADQIAFLGAALHAAR